MKRLVTAAVTVPAALAAVFYLPGPWFLLAVVVLMVIGAQELVRLARHLAPAGPHGFLYLFVPLMVLALVPDLWLDSELASESVLLWFGMFLVAIVMSALVLWFGGPPSQALASIGLLAFGTAYLALPAASLFYLQQLDPWVLVLLFAIVWLGDTAAFYFGSAFGKRKLAPRVSPNKTWEGSLAALVAATVAAALWSHWRLGSIEPLVVGVAAVTSIAAQFGDLVESMLKRGAEVKDSGTLFPGHGGLLDRLDALLFAAPVLLLSLHVFRLERWLR